MNYLLLKILHLAGVFALFSSLGATTLASSSRKAVSILHGVALLIIIIAGFAMLKKPPMGQYWWVAKLVLWIFIGVAPVLAKRNMLPRAVVLMLTIAAAVGAAWLGLAKPF